MDNGYDKNLFFCYYKSEKNPLAGFPLDSVSFFNLIASNSRIYLQITLKCGDYVNIYDESDITKFLQYYTDFPLSNFYVWKENCIGNMSDEKND